MIEQPKAAAAAGIFVLAPRHLSTTSNPVQVDGKTSEGGDHTCTLTPTGGGGAITQVQTCSPGAFTFDMGPVTLGNYNVNVVCGAVASGTNNFNVA